jgi:hypothetical protein
MQVCGQPGAFSFAGRTALHGVTGAGAAKRSASTGGAANGTPRNDAPNDVATPSTAPLSN